MSHFDLHRVVDRGFGEFPGADALHDLASNAAGEVKTAPSVTFVSRKFDGGLALGSGMRDAATVMIRFDLQVNVRTHISARVRA